MADLAWSMRADFQVTTSVPADEAVRIADEAPSRLALVILSDHGDSVFGARRATARCCSTRSCGAASPDGRSCR